ncbi:MAG: hypothetical protein OEZ36_11890 [Spirochaetota bacterium]|nr:hypothetical protein [Spirochaetota bacterium]
MANIIENSKSIVITGAWNTAILTPDWFKREFPKILEQKPTDTQVSLFDGALKFTINNILFEPKRNLFRLTALDNSLDTIKSMVTVCSNTIEKLPHTPLKAVGHNVTYSLETNEDFVLFDNNKLEEYKELYSEVTENDLVSSEYQHTIAFEDFYLNIYYITDFKERNISYNFHYDGDKPDSLKDFINNFDENINYTQTLIAKLIRPI